MTCSFCMTMRATLANPSRTSIKATTVILVGTGIALLVYGGRRRSRESPFSVEHSRGTRTELSGRPSDLDRKLRNGHRHEGLVGGHTLAARVRKTPSAICSS